MQSLDRIERKDEDTNPTAVIFTRHRFADVGPYGSDGRA